MSMNFSRRPERRSFNFHALSLSKQSETEKTEKKSNSVFSVFLLLKFMNRRTRHSIPYLDSTPQPFVISAILRSVRKRATSPVGYLEQWHGDNAAAAIAGAEPIAQEI